MTRDKASRAFRSLVESLPRPCGSVAIALLDQAGVTVRPDRLSKWMNEHHDDVAPLHIVWALQAQAGKTIVSDLMSAEAGAQDIATAAEVLASQATMLAAKANAKVTASTCRKRPGGRETTAREAADCIKDIDRAVDGLMATRRALEGAAAGEKEA